eukprot:CAMPEP_0184966392 /NCGR_PEP_ID=MMETSP1098-20130426/62_1 /TAXON_ID=89044 /ORGANISM="Spumella elongata, Strain CCAP 955/1" /LENGTH=215 /DNA_ID=CAMNT_0027487657 /DNA_START=348 /DNA_END=995 /DNA_ORIENTATION=-
MKQFTERLMNKISQKFSEHDTQQITFRKEINSSFDELESCWDTLEVQQIHSSNSAQSCDETVPPITLANKASEAASTLLLVPCALTSSNHIRNTHCTLANSSFLLDNLDVPPTLVGTDIGHLVFNTSSTEDSLCFSAEAVPDSVVGTPVRSILVVPHIATVDTVPAAQHYSKDIRKKHVVANRLSILRGFAASVASTTTVNSSQHKVWKPGLNTA